MGKFCIKLLKIFNKSSYNNKKAKRKSNKIQGFV